MSKKIRFVLSMMILIGLGACSQLPQSTSTQPLSAKDSLSIEGSLAYRERIALPPQSRITVTLSDISIADRSAPVLAQQSF
ncbi:MAG: YbaY family lipoprotein [Pseudomonadales bacterium]